MEYQIPTIYEDLLQILRQVFNKYRMNIPSYEPVTLEKISLEKLPETKLEESELQEISKQLLKGEQQREIFEREQSLAKDIKVAEEKLGQLEGEYLALKNGVIKEYETKIKAYKIEAEKRGIANSTISVEKISSIYAEMQEKINLLETEKSQTKTKLQETIARLSLQKEGVKEYYKSLHESEIASKTAELKSKESERQIEVIKYNNQVEEKMVKHANQVEQTQLTSALKYFELKIQPMSKDELIDVGYYEEVLYYVKGYLDTMTASNAYRELLDRAELITFLDDFYEETLSLYKFLANG